MKNHFIQSSIILSFFSICASNIAIAQNNHRPQQGQHRQPPMESVEACKTLSAGQSCQFTTERGTEQGTCFAPKNDLPLACAPNRNSQRNASLAQRNNTTVNNSKTIQFQANNMIEKLSEFVSSKFLDNYTIQDAKNGTQVDVRLHGDSRTISSNALPNHVTGQFPNKGNPNTISSQEKSWSFPLNPKYIGNAVWAREPGVAVNGVKFEPETNERVECDSGEVYRIEAVQDMLDLGLDFNKAHVQPTGEYHYHGVSQELVNFSDDGKDLVHIGFAADGFLILYSKSGAYQPSFKLKTTPRTGNNCIYKTHRKETLIKIDNTMPDGSYVSDWEFVEGLGDLDQCDGTFINEQYVYIVSDQYPYVGRCLNGEFSQQRGPQSTQNNNRIDHQHPH